MSAARYVPALAGRRGLLRSLVAGAAVAASVVLVPAAASADEPAGTTVVGELVQAWSEAEPGAEDHAGEELTSWVQTSSGESLRVPTEDLSGVPAGATVELTVGEPDGDDDPLHAVIGTEVVAPPATPVLTNTAGRTNQVTVALVAPAGTARDDVTTQQIVDLVDGPVAGFWAEQTDGAIAVGVTGAHDWITPTVGCSDPTALWNEVAATVGFVPGPGRHLLLYVSSRATDCSYALAEVGAAPASGGRMYVRDTTASVIAHELGHNFGLGHSSAHQCDGAVESASCRTVGYRDYYDVMGVSWSQLGSLNAPQAARLGVLPATAQQSFTVSAAPVTITLAPVSGRTGTRAVRLTDAEGADYWLEYRPAAGRDTWLGSPANRFGLDAGVLLRRSGAMPDTSLLLDATSSPAGGWDADRQAALPVGATVPVSGNDFTVVVDGVGPAGAVVTITPSGSAAPAVQATHGEAAAPAVLLGTDSVAPVVAAAPQLVVPDHRGTQALQGGPQLQPVAGSTSTVGVVMALAATLLAGVALLAVRTVRARRLRRG